jgi:hypothetical protein
MMFRVICTTILAASFCSSIQGMPGVQHNRGALLLRGTAAELGGAANMTVEQIARVGSYMDHTLRFIGEYNVGNSGKPLSPSNHNELFHNPLKVAKTLSGTGEIDHAILNVARLHKIQDIAANSRPVDGFIITDQRRAEAQKILDFVKRNGRLPKNLPVWVDAVGTETGVLVGNATRSSVGGSLKSVASGTRYTNGSTSRAVAPMRIVLGPDGRHIIIYGPRGPRPFGPPPRPFPRPFPKPIPPAVAGGLAAATSAALTAGGLVFVIDTGIELVSYSNGNISHGDLKSAINKAGIRAGAVGAATWVVYTFSATPHVMVLIGVGVVAYVAADYAIATWTDHWGTTPLDLNELSGLLPADVINRPMLADIFLQD